MPHRCWPASTVRSHFRQVAVTAVATRPNPLCSKVATEAGIRQAWINGNTITGAQRSECSLRLPQRWRGLPYPCTSRGEICPASVEMVDRDSAGVSGGGEVSPPPCRHVPCLFGGSFARMASGGRSSNKRNQANVVSRSVEARWCIGAADVRRGELARSQTGVELKLPFIGTTKTFAPQPASHAGGSTRPSELRVPLTKVLHEIYWSSRPGCAINIEVRDPARARRTRHAPARERQ